MNRRGVRERERVQPEPYKIIADRQSVKRATLDSNTVIIARLRTTPRVSIRSGELSVFHDENCTDMLKAFTAFPIPFPKSVGPSSVTFSLHNSAFSTTPYTQSKHVRAR